MFALVQDGSITKYFSGKKGVTIEDIQYPKAIFTLWSKSEREAIGIYEVIFDDSNKKDEAYYNNTNQSFDYADGEVTASYGSATAKKLDDINEVDEAGEPVLDDNGNQIVTKGLKSQKKDIIKQQASGLLAPTDWYVLKAIDVEDYSVPSAVSNFRSNVRTKSNEMETAIDNASDVDALKALYEYTEQADGSFARPLGEFQTLEI